MTPLLLKIWRLLHLNRPLQLFLMRFLQDQFLVGVTGIIFNEYNNVLLFKHTYRHIPWSLPGGYIHAREHPKEALEREIEEESGLIVSVDDRLKIRTDRKTARLDICYTGLFIGGQFKKSDEVEEYGLFSIDNLPLLPNKQLILINSALTIRLKLQQENFQKSSSHESLNLLTRFRRMFYL